MWESSLRGSRTVVRALYRLERKTKVSRGGTMKSSFRDMAKTRIVPGVRSDL